MKLVSDEIGTFTFTRDNGEEVLFSYKEINFIEYELEKLSWRSGMEDQIEYDEDDIDFSEISKEEFLDLCMEDLESRAENMTLGNDIDYGGIVFDVAQENGMWRD